MIRPSSFVKIIVLNTVLPQELLKGVIEPRGGDSDAAVVLGPTDPFVWSLFCKLGPTQWGVR